MHPVNADAIREGRSSRVPLPGEFRWIVLTRNINTLIGSAYTIEQVKQMSCYELELLQMWIVENGERK